MSSPTQSSGLIVYGEEAIAPKDFRTEVRGVLDIDHLLEKRAVIRLNEEATGLEEIVMSLVTAMAAQSPGEAFDCIQIRKEIFSFDGEQTGTRLTARLQGYNTSDEGVQVRQSWATIYGSVPGLLHRHIGISRLSQPTNLGAGLEECVLLIVVLAPKGTKSALETARSFSSLLLKDLLLLELQHAPDPESVIECLRKQAYHSESESGCSLIFAHDHNPDKLSSPFRLASGIRDDFNRRWKCYKSDWIDGVKDLQSISKSISTVFFLICTIVPTAIAYAMLNDGNTHGLINVQKVVLGQAIGGIVFALIGGQPMLILSTSAPLSIYIHVIYKISTSTGWQFYSLYVCTGLWCQAFLAIAAVVRAADLLKFSRRSTEEMFSLFIATALSYKAIKAMVHSYTMSHAGCHPPHPPHPPPPPHLLNLTDGLLPHPPPPPPPVAAECLPHAALLFILLCLATFWLSTTLDSFRNTPYLSRVLRNLLSDYGVPLAMLAMALVAHFLFFAVPKETFNLYPAAADLTWVPFWELPFAAHAVCFGLAIPLAVLFFVDQLLVTKTVDNNQNKLVKGPAHHWDLLIVAVLNVFLSLACLPWMHAALPQAYLHLRSLADVEERLTDGRVQQVIVKPREARPAVLVAHIAIVFLYAFALPFISKFVPAALFQGLFLYMAVSSLGSNQFWHRLLLLATEQRAYPPTSYIRRVPQRVIHAFTITQVLQLAVLLIVGLSPVFYISMLFPTVIALFVPIRVFILPRLFQSSHLEVVDGSH